MRDKTEQIEQSGNIATGRRKKMSVHAASFGKMMSMFSNQYSNGPLAVVREYFCNGDDSRIAAGSDRPTEVWLPSELNPTLVVRDYGLGLDADGLETTFATYLLSTKDEDDDATGHFGIGSKVGFTLGQQFTVTGYKNGVKTTTLFALDEKGEAYSDILFEGPTEEPNGVKVEVGVPDVETMRHEAEQFFLTVPKGRALVDGQEPKHLFDTVEHERFNDEVVLVKDGHGAIRVQMGPVVYRVNSAIMRTVAQRMEAADLPAASVARSMHNWSSTDSILIEVGMGDVTLAPSREDLRDTEATLNRLAAAVQGIHDFIVNDVQARVDAAPSRYAAALVARDAVAELKGFQVRKSQFTYQGQEKPFKTEISFDREHPVFFLTTYNYRSSRMVVNRDDNFTLDLKRAENMLVVVGVKDDEVSKVSRYAKRFLEDEETTYQWIMVTQEAAGSHEWFEWGTEHGASTMTLDEYRAALREMRARDPRPKAEPSYTTGWSSNPSRDLDDREPLSEILSWGKDVIIFHSNPRIYDAEAAAILDAKFTPIILLGTQSRDALVKRIEADGTVNIFEGNWRNAVADALKAQIPAPTEAEREAYGALQWLRNNTGYRGSSNWAKGLKEAVPESEWERIAHHPAIVAENDTFDLASLMAEDITTERINALDRLSAWTNTEFTAIPFEVTRPELAEVWPIFSQNGINKWEMKRNAAYAEAVISYIESTI